MKKDESHCDLFHLSVTVKGELEYSKSNILEEVTLNKKLNMNWVHCNVYIWYKKHIPIVQDIEDLKKSMRVLIFELRTSGGEEEEQTLKTLSNNILP